MVVGILGVITTTSKMMRSAKSDQLHWLAVGIAASKVQEIKSNPLQKVQLTAIGTTTGWFADANANPAAGCNCATVDWSKMTPIPAHGAVPNASFPYSEIITLNGIAFTCKVCTNRLEGTGAVATWTPYCPAPLGTVPTTSYQSDYRLVRVQVTWLDSQGQTLQTDAETLMGMQL
jgi:hypothetical protein